MDPRFHGLDGLRGVAMLMGITLHATIPYWIGYWAPEAVPHNSVQSWNMWILYHYIDIWRVPVFFLLAGFFAHLIINRHNNLYFIRNRFIRVIVPFIVIGLPIICTTPAIWTFGFKGTFGLPHTLPIIGFIPNIEQEGLLGHLWFLYYLVIFYIVLIGLDTIRYCCKIQMPFKSFLLTIIYSKIPVIPIALLISIRLFMTFYGNGEGKYVWPLNWPDVLYHLVFFLYGYGLYLRKDRLLDFQSGLLLILFISLAATTLALSLRTSYISWTIWQGVQSPNILLALIGSSSYDITVLRVFTCITRGIAGILFPIALVGLFSRFITKPYRITGWLVDASYWIYLLHFPIVFLLNFLLFPLLWNPMIKYSLVCGLTLMICAPTYRYLVRYTVLGKLLNGKRLNRAQAPYSMTPEKGQ